MIIIKSFGDFRFWGFDSALEKSMEQNDIFANKGEKENAVSVLAKIYPEFPDLVSNMLGIGLI